MDNTIYIKLLDEGIDVWRPVLAQRLDGELFLILLAPYNLVPSDEQWEFLPGSHVLTKEIVLDGGLVRVAYQKIDI